jgi:hypothetical protein
MNPRIRRWSLAVLGACAAVAACEVQSPTQPQAPASTSRAAAAPRRGEIVALLKRTEPLRQPLVASALIGPRGGRIRLERAGFEIDFPKGAVPVPTRITVTALAGRNVAYEFEPHGIAFVHPATVHQDLRHTVAWNDRRLAARLEGCYFERLLVDPTETFARSLEPRHGKLRNADQSLDFTVEHFSGYMVSTGKSGIDIDVDIDITSR